ncbi:DNA protecting protein DprA [Leptolyngbya sp. 'hensonii']|uniref:DNA-processing protein DprA n=1 Tax=Leptolyngbya sp. 'hensonii' TaxID=1922337 RepID=UPI00094FB8FD|nr:DNA-processing protein DprA [Leptolyngbya sp. 'hensonii']OLP18534.1 DNA protecting protein DprA [Leptolyngbya sp. 'hensonii']
MQEERLFWLAWSQIPGIGSVMLNRLRHRFGTLKTAWEAEPAVLMTVEGVGPQMLEAIVQTRPTIQLEQSLQQPFPCWVPDDPDYPPLLLEIPSSPAVLYYRGQVAPGEHRDGPPCVAIVGTRHPSEYGRRWTRSLTRALVRQGLTIVSGLATGIDTEAHRSCLEAGGRTLAVLGSGVDVIYPTQNQPLYQQILNQGLVLSEYPAGTKPDRGHFPQRNRIVAGLCRAVIVVEAPVKSGALITAHLANDYGREVYVLPGSLDNPQSIGCLGLISKGAQVILGEDHLLEMLGTIPALDGMTSSQPPAQLSLPISGLAPELQQVLQAVRPEPTPFDMLVQRSGLPAATVSSTLLQLELLGLVNQLPGMRYQASDQA